MTRNDKYRTWMVSRHSRRARAGVFVRMCCTTDHLRRVFFSPMFHRREGS